MRRTDQRRAAIFALYQREVTGARLEEVMERVSLPEDQDAEREVPLPAGGLTDFSRDLVHGVDEHTPELDALLEQAAQDWSLERIAPLERSILRTALYEVAIDEAVEAAKTFCGVEAPGFVNGVLGGVVRALERQRVGDGGNRG
jgi:N utilization substance protein B